MNGKKMKILMKYVVLVVVGGIMIYPLIWMVGASFKANSEIFTEIGFWPKNPTLNGYQSGIKGYAGLSLLQAMKNTYTIVLPKVVVTVFSVIITSYGFTRFHFKGRNVMFAVLMSTLFFPQVVLNVPQYILFNQIGWTNSYLPIIVPAAFAGDTYFVFMLIQFLRGIPIELEEAAYIDGCGTWTTLWKIICPVLKPAIVSCALFQFMWVSNDFMGPLLYVQSNESYPVSIFLKMSMDETGFEWNKILAMSIISIIPSLLVFFLAQDSFVEGIVSGGVKG